MTGSVGMLSVDENVVLYELDDASNVLDGTSSSASVASCELSFDTSSRFSGFDGIILIPRVVKSAESDD